MSAWEYQMPKFGSKPSGQHSDIADAMLYHQQSAANARATVAAQQATIQNQFLSAQQQAMMGMPTPDLRILVTTNTLQRKVEADFDRLCAQLPYGVVLRVTRIEARHTDASKRHAEMVVAYDTGKEIVLELRGNSFPSDADVARVVIECP